MKYLNRTFLATSLFAIACMIFLSGCASDGMTGGGFDRYRPDISGFSGPRHEGSVEGVRNLKVGDKLRIKLYRTPDVQPPMDEVIDDQGYVTLALIGKIRLANKSLSQAKAFIEETYVAKGYYKRIEVSIFRPDEGEYFIRGEVKGPGKMILTADMTLMKAVSAAGGYTEFANPKKIYIMRRGKRLEFNGKRIEDDDESDPAIQAGDIIIVDERWM